MYPGPSLLQDYSISDSIPEVSAGAAFPKAASSSFPVGLSLDSLGSTQGIPYTFTAPSDWPQEAPGAHSADKMADIPQAKQDHKAGAAGAKHQPPVSLPPPVAPSQKLSLDKYREKQATEQAAQKRRQDHAPEVEPRDAYALSAPTDPAPHRRKPHPHLQQAPGCSSTPTASPHKMKAPQLGGERRDKAHALKLRIPIPSADREELKMKVKVSSSERHSSSDEGGAKSKHSSPLVAGREKHREHSAHRHQKHGHAHPHQHSGNGRGGPEGPSAALTSPVGCSGEGAGTSSSSSSSSRKRAHPDASHNHHSKSSKSWKSAGSASHCYSVKQCVCPLAGVILTYPSPPPSSSSSSSPCHTPGLRETGQEAGGDPRP